MGFFKEAKPADAPKGYAAHRERVAERAKKAATAGREIGPIPAVAVPKRRAKCKNDFGLFARTYFPDQFTLPWSRDHPRVIAKMQRCAQEGGLFGLAMPRGSGKTTLAECCAMYASAYGFRRFIMLLGSTDRAAIELLDSIKVELETNDLLAADFPEMCFPIRALEGIAQRSRGQLCQGQRTRIRWDSDQIVLPWIEGAASSGVIIRTAGILGRVRGAKYKRHDGVAVRPDFCIPDDPQTDESANSREQCAKRLRILTGAVLGLAGPGKKIACVVPITVIRPGDAADQLLDRERCPAFAGERTRLADSLPTNVELWDRYFEIRREDQRREAGVERCNAFYVEHREAMDAGSVVAWPERFEPDELSAIQHVQNIRCDKGDEVFEAEYQNNPRPPNEKETPQLRDADVLVKSSRRPRSIVPAGAEIVTAFCDVQKDVLYWLVAAFAKDFSGTVIDYGTVPDQRVRWFELHSLTDTLDALAPDAGIEGRIYAGLEAFGARVLAREWERDDGTKLRIGRALVDANWGEQTDTVYKWARQTAHAAIVLPSHGVGIGPDSVPISSYKQKPNERIGTEWIVKPNQRRAMLAAHFDANWWKSFAESRIRSAMADKGSLQLFGVEQDHRLFAAHLTSEFRTRTTGRGRTVDVWKPRPERFDNHWLDCLVGALVAASIQGAALAIGAGKPDTGRRKKAHVSYF